MDSPLSLGACTNSNCNLGCGIFIPDTSGVIPALEAMVKCAICTCVAGQHIKPGAPAMRPAAPQPPPAPSATHSTQFKSRTNPFASAAPGGTTEKLSGPFRAATQQREDKKDAERRHPLNGGNVFNPTAASHVEANLNPHNSSSKKRKRSAINKSGSASAPSAVRSKKSVPATVFDVALVEGTKLVAQDRYSRPGPEKLVSLAEHGYVKKVVLPKTSTSDDIRHAVLAAYEHIPEIAEHGFRVVIVKKKIGVPSAGF
ncbi:hypothetical protein C8R47DRAFT_1223703 [Mycena vitilis]|nr:hypothetical protein C8R47DRAFT_1223703 [Mycena vitilis]